PQEKPLPVPAGNALEPEDVVAAARDLSEPDRRPFRLPLRPLRPLDPREPLLPGFRLASLLRGEVPPDELEVARDGHLLEPVFLLLPLQLLRALRGERIVVPAIAVE